MQFRINVPQLHESHSLYLVGNCANEIFSKFSGTNLDPNPHFLELMRNCGAFISFYECAWHGVGFILWAATVAYSVVNVGWNPHWALADVGFYVFYYPDKRQGPFIDSYPSACRNSITLTGVTATNRIILREVQLRNSCRDCDAHSLYSEIICFHV